MRRIVITLPHFIDGEAERIALLLRQGIADIIHIRKPEGNYDDVEALIKAIPQELYSRLVLHDHFDLAVRYHLYGVHLNGRNPLPPEGWEGSVSKSCHSLYEVVEWKTVCDYVSLSPIFDSISKKGYSSAFSSSELVNAHDAGIIDSRVYALGGITFDKVDALQSYGFGGCMILGDAWKES